MHNQTSSQYLPLKIIQISNTYKNLLKAESSQEKKYLIGQLRNLCTQALKIIDKEIPTSQNARKRRQIEDILKRSNEIQQKMNRQLNEISNERNSLNSEQLRKKSIQVARQMIVQVIKSREINITKEQLDQVANRVQTINEVMKLAQQMVIKQGGNVEIIKQNIHKNYENVVKTNQELEEAKEEEKLYLRLRMKLVGVLGGLGYVILGLPGLIFGFLSGLRMSS